MRPMLALATTAILAFSAPALAQSAGQPGAVGTGGGLIGSNPPGSGVDPNQTYGYNGWNGPVNDGGYYGGNGWNNGYTYNGWNNGYGYDNGYGFNGGYGAPPPPDYYNQQPSVADGYGPAPDPYYGPAPTGDDGVYHAKRHRHTSRDGMMRTSRRDQDSDRNAY